MILEVAVESSRRRVPRAAILEGNRSSAENSHAGSSVRERALLTLGQINDDVIFSLPKVKERTLSTIPFLLQRSPSLFDPSHHTHPTPLTPTNMAKEETGE